MSCIHLVRHDHLYSHSIWEEQLSRGGKKFSLVLTATQASLHVPPAAPEAHSHGRKSPGTPVFHSQRLFGPGAESYSLLLHAVLKEIRLGAGPICTQKDYWHRAAVRLIYPRDQRAEAEVVQVKSRCAINTVQLARIPCPWGRLNTKVVFIRTVQDLSRRPHFQSNLPWLLESHCVGQLPSITVRRIHLKHL